MVTPSFFAANSSSPLIMDANQATAQIQPIKVQRMCIKFNPSDPFNIGDRYGGIPLNLLTNFIGWSILIILFIFIRKNAVRAMGFRLASNTVQWTQVFFGGENQTVDADSEESLQTDGDAHLADELIEKEAEVLCQESGDHVVVDHLLPGGNKADDDNVSRKSQASYMKNPSILTMREKKLVGLMGPDAVQYLRFQKYIIIYILLTTIVSIGVILPLNFQGTQLGNGTDFGHTTLAS